MPTAQPTFPLHPQRMQNGLPVLVDRSGKPFFYQADTAWKLFHRLSLNDAQEYLIARKAQGFTAVQATLTGFLEDLDLAGRRPFNEDLDFSKPNEDFFTHADTVVQMANDLGLLMALAPLWSGCCGEGWAGLGKDGTIKPVNANGPHKCRDLGKWIGRRFQKHNNIMWIMGGDNDPENCREELRQLAAGIKSAAPDQLMTYHAASTHSSTDVWPANESWLDVSMIYTYFRGFDKAWNRVQLDVYETASLERRKIPSKPFILGESTYEGEHGAWGSALQVRKQAYWAMLSGACGHAYGSPNWHLPENWREILDMPGASSLNHLHHLLAQRTWWLLEPDEDGVYFVAEGSTRGNNDYTAAAVTPDKRLAIIYSPNLGKICCHNIPIDELQTTWFDPSDGSSHIVALPQPIGPGYCAFTPPGSNSAGEPDWVLILERNP